MKFVLRAACASACTSAFTLLQVLFATCLLPTPGQAALGDVVHSFPCAGPNSGDLAWVEGMLYQVIFSPVEQRMIYQLSPIDGAVLGTIPSSGSSPQGITYDGHNLWQCDLAGDRIYKLDPLTGGVRGQWAAPGGTDSQPIGLGWDGELIWLGDSRDPEKIWQLDTLGTVISQIPAPGDSPYGLAWAGGYIWVSDNNVGGGAIIYKLDPADGSIIDSFVCPNDGGAPNGITHDGEYLWVADNITDLIYQVDDGMEGTGVDPVLVVPLPGLRVEGASFRDGSVEVTFTVPEHGGVVIGLFDVLGRREACTAQQSVAPGPHLLALDAHWLPSGVHFLRVCYGEQRVTQRLVVTR